MYALDSMVSISFSVHSFVGSRCRKSTMSCMLAQCSPLAVCGKQVS